MKTELSKVKNWQEFEALAAESTAKERGDLFELLTKYYLLLDPTYKTKLSDVWLLSEVPQKIRTALNLPANDQGIDIIARTKTGAFWGVQCKYRGSAAHSLTWREISTFAGLTFGVCKSIDFGLIAYTGERYSKVLDMAEHVAFLSNDVWSTLDESFFLALAKALKGKREEAKAYHPRPHQKRAIEKATEYFANEENTRGKLIMPCGSGKSLTGFWIAEALKAKTVVVAVPSLALIQQTLPVWLREYAARGEKNLRWLCVCSDQTVTKDTDSVIVHTQDLGYPCLTNSEEIQEWLKETSTASPRVIFTTYQSGKAVAEAMREEGVEVDLGIMDEAHKTVGQKDKLFSHLLFDENLTMKRRVFMTATERRYAGKDDEIISMDDAKIYGDTFELLTFKEALEQNPAILSDYKIITMVISKKEVENLISENRYIRPSGGMWSEEIESQMLASLVALRKAMKKYPIKHAVSFHSSIPRAHAFKDFNDTFTEFHLKNEELDTFHVTGAMPSVARKQILTDFAKTERALITNARCLTEGVDVPNIDCVLFADPKRSTINIVQAIGRALRPSKGKKFGYILVPIISDSKDADSFVESPAFLAIISVLRALASNDERIIEHFRAIHQGRRIKGGTVEIDIDEKIATRINIKQFAEEIETKVWGRLARLSWMPYAEATNFVHTLGLKNKVEWAKYCQGERTDLPAKPADIPVQAPRVYSEFLKNGGWGGWLGTTNRKGGWRPFRDALMFAQNLNLKSSIEWKQYVKGDFPKLPSRPIDIPANPHTVYANEFRSNGGWGGWLGTGFISPLDRNFIPYDECVMFVHKLNLNSQKEWKAYYKGERSDLPPFPVTIPRYPDAYYKKEFYQKGGWGGWFGTSRRRGGWRALNDAKKFVHTLDLKNMDEWVAYAQGKRPELPKKPYDIPNDPYTVYGEDFKETGGMRAWIRSGQTRGNWRPYKSAVQFSRKLGLKTRSEWDAYCKGLRKDLPELPSDIPVDIKRVYGSEFRAAGGWSTWLNSDFIQLRDRQYRTYVEAVAFVHKLGLSSSSQWSEYCKGKIPKLPPKPSDIPSNASAVYKKEFKDKGGWGAWVGTGYVANRDRKYRPYKDAIKFVHSLDLKNRNQWDEYCKGKFPKLPQKPADIPSNVYQFYGEELKSRGGMKAWLGTHKTHEQ